MSVRTFLSLALGVTASVALAQTPAASPQVLEGRIRQGYETLKEANLFVASMAGIETIGKTTNRVDAVIFLQSQLDGSALLSKLELRVYRNGVLSSRTVGDGTTLWIYNATRNEYSTKVYGAQGNQPMPESYLKNLLTLADSQATGQVSNLTKLVRQLYAESNPRYISWTPGVTPVDKMGNVLYYDNNTVVRSVLFRTVPTDTGWALDGIDGYEARYVRSSLRTLEWTIDLSAAGAAKFVPDFTFVAPTNARPVTSGG